MPYRVERANSLIRQELSELLLTHVKDPRLGNNFITVTEVVTTSDFKHARVYVSSIIDGDEKKKVSAALDSAAGFLRRELSNRLKMRYTPELHFQWENSIEHGDHILKLINEVVNEENA